MSNKISLQTNKTIRPVIYCFTTPDNHANDGYCKIGYTDRQTADERIEQESFTTNTFCKKEWEWSAIFENGCYEPFTDHDFHKYLEKIGIERLVSVYGGNRRKTEFFKITPQDAEKLLMAFKKMTDPSTLSQEYTLRDEQKAAVDLTDKYMDTTSGKKEVLINAKPRFGKTLTVYDYCKSQGFQNILIVTNRPVIATSWYDDYVKFLGTDEYIFVSNCDSVKDKDYCCSRDEYVEKILKAAHGKYKCIEFVSLQDLKGSKWFGGHFDKLKEVADINWDVLVVDESHEGVDTFKTNVAFNQIKRKETIFLSGTPFKQIASSRFPEEAIFNWTYAQEQEMKNNWDYETDEVNPYEDLPQLNLYTYRLFDMFADDDRMNENLQRERFFNLNEFFSTKGDKTFTYERDVDTFLNTITSVEKYPLANNETKAQIKHSLWLLDRVDSAKALYKKLKSHPAFQDYEIIIAAGDGRVDDDEKIDDALNKVKEAIKKFDKTITLSVGQLTTGVTVPEWSAVFMLCNVKSPSLYIQASFRAQNPCLIKDNHGAFTRKENAYIFDFDPARTLDIMGQFANNLYAATASGKGDIKQREHNIEQLIKYFPIKGEDEDGNLVEYKPVDVINIPSKIQSKEIVRHGFMCDFLFQNVGKIFGDPKAMEILNGVREVKDKSRKSFDAQTVAETVGTPSYNSDGEAKIEDSKIDENKQRLEEDIKSVIPTGEAKAAATTFIPQTIPAKNPTEFLATLKQGVPAEKKKAAESVVDQFAKERAERIAKVTTEAVGKVYGDSSIFNAKKVAKDITDQYQAQIKEAKINHDIEMERLRHDWNIKRSQQTESTKVAEVVQEYQKECEKAEFDFACTLDAIENTFISNTLTDQVKTLEKKQQEKINKSAENEFAFPKLKAFARSIPSFLMAYGDETTTCDKFGEIIPKEIFKEMTGIELDDYMYFIEKQYFNEVVFNEAIKEFLDTKERLKNYFDDAQIEDIFDYIPPQKTNQIFTPKKVVKEMCDLLEENDPGCFDDKDKTFIDLYMKSGLYIAEIVKRLFRSEKMKLEFPNDMERLKHIFKNQVYGLAPTEIIFNIAKNFVLGFDKSLVINDSEHNLRLFDATPYAQNGTLDEELKKLFGFTDE